MDFKGRTVFIPQDFMLVDVFNEITQRLEARGIEVIRGPESRPGEKVSFPKEHWDQWFSRAEVAMFSTRNICTREMMAYAPRLRGIVNPTIGLETVDTDAANELGIIVGHGATPAPAIARRGAHGRGGAGAGQRFACGRGQYLE